MIIGSTDRYYLLNEPIPYRIRLLDNWITTQLMFVFQNHDQHRFGSDDFHILTRSGALQLPLGDLHNLTIESGLVQARMLLEFLGIRLKGEDQLIPIVKKKYPDDVFICDITNDAGTPLKKVDPAWIRSLQPLTLPDQRTATVEELICYLLSVCGKSATHLTYMQKPDPGYRWIVGALIVRALVELHVYEPLRQSYPSHLLWSQTVLQSDLYRTHERWYRTVRGVLTQS